MARQYRTALPGSLPGLLNGRPVADTDITIAQLNTEIGSVKTYIRAGNWTAARRECVCAQATLAGLEDSLSAAGRSIHYRSEIAKLYQLIEEAEAHADLEAQPRRAAFARTCYNGRQTS